nr:syntaxin-22-like [Arachis hypogaea]
MSSFRAALVAASSLLAGGLPSSLLVAVSSGEGYEPVLIQRKKRILKQRLKVPPALNQFTKTLDKNIDIALSCCRQEVLFLDNEIAFNEAIIEEREQGIQEIQQQIGEVNEIFKDLAVFVHEQEAMIDDIGSNIEQSHAAIAQARSQLAKASKTQRSNSSLVIYIV